MQTFMTLSRYKQNLKTGFGNDLRFEKIYSYNTEVAQIDHANKIITVETWYSVTTSKHINFVANQYGYKLNLLYLKK